MYCPNLDQNGQFLLFGLSINLKAYFQILQRLLLADSAPDHTSSWYHYFGTYQHFSFHCFFYFDPSSAVY